MKMVIQQLDGILKELKDVAKELREVSFISRPRSVAFFVPVGAGGLGRVREARGFKVLKCMRLLKRGLC